MFVTTSTFKRSPPQSLTTPARYWAGVILAEEMPWFVLTYRLFESSEAPLQTVLVACVETLVQVIERLDLGSVTSLRWVVHANDEDRRWVMKDVAELWLPSKAEQLLTGPLLWRLAGESGLRGASGAVPASGVAGRRMVVVVNSGMPSPQPSPASGRGRKT
jgi:hypothetical protein